MARLISFEKLSCENAGRCSERFEIEVPGYAVLDGDKLIVPLSVLRTRWDNTLPPEERRLDLELWHPFAAEEQITIEAPAGFVPSDLPRKRTTAQLGLEAKSNAKISGQTVEVERVFSAARGRHEKSKYSHFRDVLRDYQRVRRDVAVFTKTSSSAGL